MEQSMSGKTEDTIGNDCGVVDDHIVLHWSGELALFASYDPCSTSLQEALNDVQRNTHSTDVTEPVLLRNEETSFSFQNDQSSAMLEFSACSKGATTFSKQSEKNFNRDTFSSLFPGLSEMSAPDETRDGVFPLDRNLQVGKLVHQDWADIGSYHDLDIMFSPMFEQQSSVVGDDISWSSSTSNLLCASSDTLKLGPHSSSRTLGIMNSILNQNSANTNPLSEDSLLTIDFGKDHRLDCQSRSFVRDADNKTKSEEKINKKLKGLEWQFSAEEKSNGQPSEVSDSQNNWHDIGPHHVPMEYNLPLCQTQLTLIESSIESEKDHNPSLSYKALANPTSCSWQYTDLLPDPVEEKVQKQSLREPSYRDIANSYSVQEPYRVFPPEHEGEYDVGSFQRLQDVLGQLDHKARQCLRDGLHRMARRTEKRNCFMNFYDDNADHTTREGTNDTQKFHEIMDAEGDTNIIDLSVALLLLFQISSTHDTSAACVAAPSEFHAVYGAR